MSSSEFIIFPDSGINLPFAFQTSGEDNQIPFTELYGLPFIRCNNSFSFNDITSFRLVIFPGKF